MAEPSASLKAALANRYRVERELGHGGMATVYLAQDLKHNRPVALKVLRPELAAALGPERFLREIATVAQLTHPNILPLHDSGEATGLLYYVMPYLEGESLRDRLAREHQLPIEEALKITHEVADGLGYAHSRGVVHRDVKPENILFQAGHAVVSDFGIARAVTSAGGETLTGTGIAIGTPAYMSPEQAEGAKNVDARSDIYSLGCVLYEMLAGEPPFTGPTAQAIVAKKLSGPTPRVSLLRKTVPAEVDAALARALSPTPADRFATVQQFAAALPLYGEGSATRPPLYPGTSLRSSWLVAWAAMVIVGGGVTALVLRSHSASADLDPQLIAAMPFRAVSATPGLREMAEQIPDILWIKVTGEFGPRATDPATVMRIWQRVGGSIEAGLPEEAELRIARNQGAGRLIRGLVTGTADTVAITAELLEVPSGNRRVSPTTVKGPPDRWIRLVDSLVVLLLAKDLGIAAEQIPYLSRYSPQAIQAFLAGRAALRRGDFPEARRLDGQALEADSTFVLAALAKYDVGEVDTAAAGYVWEHQGQLDPRSRAFFRAEAGWRYGAALTEADVIAQWESVTTVWPQYAGGWFELGEHLHSHGAVAGVPRWRERARAALEREARLLDGEPGAQTWFHLYWLAITDTVQDTAAMRLYFERLKATSGPRRHLLYHLWRLALHRGDTAATADVIRRIERDPGGSSGLDAWGWLVMMALEDGLGVADADRAAKLTDTDAPSLVWARARGRRAEWLAYRDDEQLSAIRRAVLELRDALFLGEPEDSGVQAAARLVKTISAGRIAGSSPPVPDLVAARCWSTLWRIQHGDTTGARGAARYLRAEVPLPYKCPVCAGLIDVLMTRSGGGDLRVAVERWDSVVHPDPMPLFGQREDGTRGIDNLLLARLLAQVGDTSGALAAARRLMAIVYQLTYGDLESASLLVEYLREEGRLAAMKGDTAGAIRAYNHYLALREDPDYEPWRQERDQVRRELAALVGEPRR